MVLEGSGEFLSGSELIYTVSRGFWRGFEGFLEGFYSGCYSPTHPMVLDELLHVVLCQVVGLDVGLHKLLVGDGPQVRQLLQLHEELLEVQLHQGPALVATLLHVGVAAGRETGQEEQESEVEVEVECLQQVLKGSTQFKEAESSPVMELRSLEAALRQKHVTVGT